MIKHGIVLMLMMAACSASLAETPSSGEFKLALPSHVGQLRWSAEGFAVIESSAKPGGNEIGIRGRDKSGRLTFLGFLFLVNEKEPLNSAACRDNVLSAEKKNTPTVKIISTADDIHSAPLPVAVVTYTGIGQGGKPFYAVRGFVASGEICGDLEIYSDTPISADDADIKKIFTSYQLDENYAPKFEDVLLYAQMLYQAGRYAAAGPVFEAALAKLNANPGPTAKTMRRVVTDQAGMAYGMSGDIAKARVIFEKGVAEDPDYPLYYYNLACADAEEKNLSAARDNLQKAFDRKANVIPGEHMPDPTSDDSFLPFRSNKEFWTFLQSLKQ
jgi:hypothetical protein